MIRVIATLTWARYYGWLMVVMIFEILLKNIQ